MHDTSTVERERQSEDEDAEVAEVVQVKAVARGRPMEKSPRPRRQARTPARYKDFVSYEEVSVLVYLL